MGQTLEHGIYLPDEGERNCYSGLAANWGILDGAVGTVAEHTTALAGKAPAVHTHTKADITDFPAYGNAAGTICEGNDSRLSDARTPVAHTHTKSDVTDLFNSANTWSDNQIIASSNDKCYYVKDTVYELGQSYSSGEHLGGLLIQDKNGTTVGLLDIVDRSYGDTEMRVRVQQKFDPDSNNRSTSGDILYNELRVGISNTKTNYIVFNADLWGANKYNLGTSTNKWKTFNGLNPGALSIFDPSATPDPISFPNGINESGTWKYDGSAWNALNVSNLGDGWIIITYNSCVDGNYILARFGGTGGSRYPSMIFKAEILTGSPTSAYLYAFFPVAKAFGNIYLEMNISSNANLVLHHFIPAYGTV